MMTYSPTNQTRFHTAEGSVLKYLVCSRFAGLPGLLAPFKDTFLKTLEALKSFQSYLSR